MVVELGAVTASTTGACGGREETLDGVERGQRRGRAVRLVGAIQSASSEGHSVRTHFGSRLEGAGVTKARSGAI